MILRRPLSYGCTQEVERVRKSVRVAPGDGRDKFFSDQEFLPLMVKQLLPLHSFGFTSEFHNIIPIKFAFAISAMQLMFDLFLKVSKISTGSQFQKRKSQNEHNSTKK